jgi:hypothetical protein
MLLEEWQDPVIEQFHGGHRRLAARTSQSDLAVSIDEGLLVYPVHAIQGADGERVLCSTVAGTFFDLPCASLSALPFSEATTCAVHQ